MYQQMQEVRYAYTYEKIPAIHCTDLANSKYTYKYTQIKEIMLFMYQWTLSDKRMAQYNSQEGLFPRS